MSYLVVIKQTSEVTKQEIKQEVCDENKENKKMTAGQKIF